MSAVLRNSDHASQFTDTLRVRCPAALPAAIDIAAGRALMSSSEYVRRSSIERLRADGIDPAALAVSTS